ncbi:hypothetical protein C1H76_2342 [Elsinoe australis]|uniref:PHD-type domain-containing protein n=1 Tax=Elsinoe australis TaxID=40998 RepID=A0A4V6DVX7_9PEZI|nr:hypothetical protein C1H76_2342 [Elsinoe australis]
MATSEFDTDTQVTNGHVLAGTQHFDNETDGSAGVETDSASHTATSKMNGSHGDDMEIDLFDNAGWRSAPLAAVKEPPSLDSSMTSTPTNGASSSTPTRGSGRGRGRGRGGRGRASTAVNGTPHVVTSNGTDVASTPTNIRGSGRGRSRTRSVARGGRGGRGGKRRRDSDEIKAEDSPSDAHPSEDEAEDEYTPQATATRSGRSVQKPTSFAPPPLPSPIAGVKRKRHVHRKNPELTVCVVCLRPHSPQGNMIVFCDGCNTPYHRYCHRPAISQVVVDEPDREWYCAECQRENEYQWDVALFKPSGPLTDEQKRSHLERVPQPALIQLLLHASRLHPDIPLLPPDVHTRATALSSMPPPPPPQGHTSFSLAPTPPNHGPLHLQRPPDDELETGYEADPPAHYPRAGQGLAATLPPERSHLHFLVDDNHDVYTHIWQRDAKKANEEMYGGGGGGSAAKVSEEQRNADLARRAREEIEAKVQMEMRRLKAARGEEERLRREEERRREEEEAGREEDDYAREDLEMLEREFSEGIEKGEGQVKGEGKMEVDDEAEKSAKEEVGGAGVVKKGETDADKEAEEEKLEESSGLSSRKSTPDNIRVAS